MKPKQRLRRIFRTAMTIQKLHRMVQSAGSERESAASVGSSLEASVASTEPSSANDAGGAGGAVGRRGSAPAAIAPAAVSRVPSPGERAGTPPMRQQRSVRFSAFDANAARDGDEEEEERALAERSFQMRRASFMRAPTSNSFVASAACHEVDEGWHGALGGEQSSCTPDGRLGMQRSWGTPTTIQLADAMGGEPSRGALEC